MKTIMIIVIVIRNNLKRFGNDKQVLWIRIRANCSDDILSTVTNHSRSSTIWRGILKVWPHINQNFSWIIQNGSAVKFWGRIIGSTIVALLKMFPTLSSLLGKHISLFTA